MAKIELDKSTTALLIADYYADIVGTITHAVERDCLAKTVALRAAARKANLLVAYSATVFRPGYPEIGSCNKIFVARKQSGKPAGADPVKIIHPDVRPDENEIVVGKRRVNAMFGTDLGIVLAARNIRTLIMVGYATSGVILSTARYAADMDYRLLIVEDCCIDSDASVHDFLCTRIFPRQADVVNSADLILSLGQ